MVAESEIGQVAYSIQFRKLMSISIIIVLVLSAAVLVVPEKASAGFVYSVDVQALNDTVEIGSGPGQPGFTTARFRITNNGHNLKETIEINITIGEGISSVAVSPSQFLFPDNILLHGESLDISVSVGIFRNTPPTRTFIGVCAKVLEAPWYGGDYDSTTVIIKQYSFLVIDPVQAHYSLDADSSKALDFKITNQGNGNDTILFGAVNRDELIKKGWEISDNQELTIEPKTFQTVSLKIKTPLIVLTDENVNITVRAISESKGVTANYTYSITIKVNNNAGLVIGAPIIIIILILVIIDAKTHKIGLIRLIKKLKILKK
jgi:hypothetical protein